jgi:hypothetical protein
MQNDLFTNILLLVAILFLIFIIFNTISLTSKKEGFDSKTSSSASSTKSGATSSDTSASHSTINGLAGNAQYYNSSLKDKVIKLQDTMLLSKYRADYENTIIALDDLVDNLMLQKVLSITPETTQKDLEELVQLNNSKTALNNVMKFIDSSSS